MIKKHYMIIGIALLNAGIYCAEEKIISRRESPMKKKILILTSSAGGNLQASKAMKTYLQADYTIELCPAFIDILGPIDPFNFLTFKKYSGEGMYNALVPGKNFQLLGWVYQFGKWYMQSQKEKIHVLLRDYFIKSRPDIIISVIPVINNIILNVAQELNIPFILVPTDLDVSPYIIGITQPTYKHFHMCLLFDDPDIRIPIKNALIPNECIHVIGAPIRPAFFMHKNKDVLLKKYALNENKPIIMILMGSLGSNEIKDYVARLLTIQKPLQILACIAGNEESRRDLSQLVVPQHISLSIIGFTQDIDEYMAISDLLITKSGTISICEALYMNLPSFLDATSTVLPWEQFNHTFIKKHGFGLSITKYDDVAPLVTNAIENRDELLLYKNNIQKLEKKDCSQELKKLIDMILNK